MTMINSTILLNFHTVNLLSDTTYYILCGLLVIAVLAGIHLMSKVEKAQLGNQVSALAIAFGIIITLIKKDILPVWLIYPAMAIGLIIGLIMAKRVKMIEMPQMVALLNGVGGAASAIVASFAFLSLYSGNDFFGRITSVLAVIVGTVTLTGSLVAAGKLHKIFAQRPVILPMHQVITGLLLVLTLFFLIAGGVFNLLPAIVIIIATLVFSALFGVVFSIRVGGADMPITISLLNSLSGVAAAVAGFAVSDILLVAVGGIVGASGLFLTQIMCNAMNRKLFDILLGKTSVQGNIPVKATETVTEPEISNEKEIQPDPVEIIKGAKQIIIVPGYGMALAHAQHLVKDLAKKLTANGSKVKYAIHPVAGRMPGHMDVLLIEAGVPFDDVFEMDDINDEFKTSDLTIVVGANDVLNPAARNAAGTPIYGMPILNVDQCKNIILFNYDLKPGYSGVDNPIYQRREGVWIIQGDASVTITEILTKL